MVESKNHATFTNKLCHKSKPILNKIITQFQDNRKDSRNTNLTKKKVCFILWYTHLLFWKALETFKEQIKNGQMEKRQF